MNEVCKWWVSCVLVRLPESGDVDLDDQLLSDYCDSADVIDFKGVVEKNFDNSDKIMSILNQNEKTIDKHILLFNLPEVLRA